MTDTTTTIPAYVLRSLEVRGHVPAWILTDDDREAIDLDPRWRARMHYGARVYVPVAAEDTGTVEGRNATLGRGLRAIARMRGLLLNPEPDAEDANRRGFRAAQHRESILAAADILDDGGAAGRNVERLDLIEVEVNGSLAQRMRAAQSLGKLAVSIAHQLGVAG